MPNFAELHWTPAKVRALPDDGLRYECIDGSLLVTPSPSARHQDVLQLLFMAIAPFVAARGVGHLLWSPADLELEEGTLVQPDLFIAVPRADARRIREWGDVARLRLAVEVLSPSTARYDRGLKRLFYQRAGVEEYWLVDPESRVLERWLPADARPEVVRDQFSWRPQGIAEAVEIDVAAIFATVFDE